MPQAGAFAIRMSRKGLWGGAVLRRLRSARAVRVMLAVVVFALGLGGVWWTGHNTGVFLAEVDVVLFPPQGEDPNNALTDPSRGFVDFAGIVAKSVMGASSNPAPVSESVTLVGMGVSEGWVVRQPNDGGQWSTSFSRPVLNVQATSHDPDQALARLQDVVAKITARSTRGRTCIRSPEKPGRRHPEPHDSRPLLLQRGSQARRRRHRHGDGAGDAVDPRGSPQTTAAP